MSSVRDEKQKPQGEDITRESTRREERKREANVRLVT